MELRMTVHAPARRPRPVDVVVVADAGATAADLRGALGEHLGMPVGGLLVAGRPVRDTAPVGLPPLLDGVSVAATAEPVVGPDVGGAGDHPRPVLALACVGGPDAGRSHPLEPPGVEVGRSPARGLRIDDPSLSRTHLRVDVGPDGLHVTDLGSTNGVLVDGRPAEGPTPVDTSTTLSVGASTLRVRRAPGAGVPVVPRGDGTVAVVPGRVHAADPEEVVVQAPAAPAPPHRARIPWVAALAPLPVVAGMAFFLGPRLLVFAVLGPVAVLATTLADRLGARRRGRREAAAHAEAVRTARRRFSEVVEEEVRRRHRRHPGPDDVLRAAEHRLAGLWAGPDELSVRLGLGTVPTAARWREDGADRRGDAAHVPVVLDLAEPGCLGVVAPATEARAVLAAVLGQLVVRVPPSRLSLREPVPGQRGDDDAAGWLDRLPHRRGSGRPVLVVEDATGRHDVAGLVRETTDAGGVAIVGARRAEDLPDGCGAVLTPSGGGRWILRSSHGDVDLVADGVGPAWRERLSRALAPLREEGGDAALPARLGLPDLDPRPITPQGVLDRWTSASGPRALVGTTRDGPLVVDLDADGPHVLVGGTTGSGKSEFLRTLVTGLALASPPEELTVLLVDFKGGSAFGPCAGLPHTVGLVTDLDDLLADRVLRSLRAELRRRERLLAAAAATDLDAYRRVPGVEPLPRLVVVVDELRTLVDELPDVVRELVRLAAQGRSLGIHLVLATQRPAGAVTPEVQANVNLRIAFRVRDRADAVGIVEDPRPADLPHDVPGRAVVRGGDGRLTDVQVALVRPDAPTGPPSVTVRPARTVHAGAPGAGPDRAAATAAVVEVVDAAHRERGGGPPRRPWLPPLPDRVAVADVPDGTFALVDEPDRQRRTPLPWDRATALWRVVGRPRSGRSTALRAVVRAAVATHPADRLHVHVLAATDEHADLRRLAHVGTVAQAGDADAVRALLDHLGASPAREGSDAEGPPTTLLVVDDWERLTEHDDPQAPRPASSELLRLLRDGAAGGLVAVVAGGRDLLRSSWSALGGAVLHLGTPDPLDAALLGLPGGARPTTAAPGRGLLADRGHEVQVVAPEPSWPPEVPAHSGSAGSPGRDHQASRPWRYRPLPGRIDRWEVETPTAGHNTGLLLGLAGPAAAPWRWCPRRDGRRLLVAGPPGSGRTSALVALADSAVAAARPVLLVRADPATEASWAPAPGDGRAGDRTVLGPDDVDELVARRRERPDLLLLVDDADRLDGAAVTPVLDEIAGLAERDDGAVAVATTTTSLRTRFRGLDVEVAAHRLGVLLHPGPADGDVLGAGRLPERPGAPPGRGVVVARGAVTPIQVLTPSGRPGPDP